MLPRNEFSLVQLPICLKSDKAINKVTGNREQFISSCKQGNDVTISINPDNPLMGATELKSKPSNKFILKVVKDENGVSGEIVGKVKREYSASGLLDFAYLPERQFYDIAGDNFVPHFDIFDKSNDPHQSYILPIRFTSYTTPYDINLRDNITEKGKTISKFHIFVSSSDAIPTCPRSDLAPIPPDSPFMPYFKYIQSLFERQPIWDKRYLLLNVFEHFHTESREQVQNAVTTVMPYLSYVFTDGPFRNTWIQFGYNPALHSSSWIYQYVEFRFPKKPEPLDATGNSTSLPKLYDIPLNLHNRYPLCILQRDGEMQQLISRIVPSDTYDKRVGWIPMDSLSQIRNLLKKQAEMLLERNGYNMKMTTLPTTKRRIQSAGGNHETSGGRKNKRIDPSFSASADALLQEMPLDMFSNMMQEEDDDDGTGDFYQLYGDEDGNTLVYNVCYKYIKLESNNRSGWCSGYHARFTRERSRVRSPHPIFLSFLFVSYYVE